MVLCFSFVLSFKNKKIFLSGTSIFYTLISYYSFHIKPISVYGESAVNRYHNPQLSTPDLTICFLIKSAASESISSVLDGQRRRKNKNLLGHSCLSKSPHF